MTCKVKCKVCANWNSWSVQPKRMCTCRLAATCLSGRSRLWCMADQPLWDRLGWARAFAVSDNPKFNLDIRYGAAISDREPCLMPKVGLVLAGTCLVMYPGYLFVCILMWAGVREYCIHHLPAYESRCGQWGEIEPWLFFPSALGLLADLRKGWGQSLEGFSELLSERLSHSRNHWPNK